MSTELLQMSAPLSTLSTVATLHLAILSPLVRARAHHLAHVKVMGLKFNALKSGKSVCRSIVFSFQIAEYVSYADRCRVVPRTQVIL